MLPAVLMPVEYLIRQLSCAGWTLKQGHLQLIAIATRTNYAFFMECLYNIHNI